MDDKNNTGNWNTGNRNTGNRNTGNGNTGDRNTGYDNTGNRNTGNGNTGNGNTGDWNKCNENTGYFNTIESDEIRIFNKPCSRQKFREASKPRWLYFALTRWIHTSEMTDAEKENNPEYKITGGYLRAYEYQEAAKLSWDKASYEDKMLTFELPNFDFDVAKEIFGIDFRGYYNSVNKLKESPCDEEEDMTRKEIEEMLYNSYDERLNNAGVLDESKVYEIDEYANHLEWERRQIT